MPPSFSLSLTIEILHQPTLCNVKRQVVHNHSDHTFAEATNMELCSMDFKVNLPTSKATCSLHVPILYISTKKAASGSWSQKHHWWTPASSDTNVGIQPRLWKKWTELEKAQHISCVNCLVASKHLKSVKVNWVHPPQVWEKKTVYIYVCMYTHHNKSISWLDSVS